VRVLPVAPAEGVVPVRPPLAEPDPHEDADEREHDRRLDERAREAAVRD